MPDRCHRLALCDITPNADLDPSTMCLGCHTSSTGLELCQLAPPLWGGALAGRTEVWVPETQLGCLRVLGPSPERAYNQNAFHPIFCAGESISAANSSWGPLPHSPTPTIQHSLPTKGVLSFLSHISLCPRNSKSFCLSFPPTLLSVNSGKIKPAPSANRP